ncbi:hypothetical protein [Niabella hibiscisoli]|uniref:hypothetical protein n=1 Tax=Niabella hibiscisoli TaxID=1825928 RepID=UPI001F0D14B0|nr:hypothetical protein [Niabella hibiscisoli]MCH5717353.1 hypothetical protein [Niabella hibiscisoli]
MYNRIFISSILLLALFACKNEDKKPADTGTASEDSVLTTQRLTDAYFLKLWKAPLPGNRW